jgi:hypothetical protein
LLQIDSEGAWTAFRGLAKLRMSDPVYSLKSQGAVTMKIRNRESVLSRRGFIYRADMAICTDDGCVYWRDGVYAIDAGFPVALVNHPVSEECMLTDHLRRRYLCTTSLKEACTSW